MAYDALPSASSDELDEADNPNTKTTQGAKNVSDGDWIEAATKKMKAKGTLGAFGKATAKKIKAGKAEGGLEKKRAVFASNMKKLSSKKSFGGSKRMS